MVVRHSIHQHKATSFSLHLRASQSVKLAPRPVSTVVFSGPAGAVRRGRRKGAHRKARQLSLRRPGQATQTGPSRRQASVVQCAKSSANYYQPANYIAPTHQSAPPHHQKSPLETRTKRPANNLVLINVTMCAPGHHQGKGASQVTQHYAGQRSQLVPVCRASRGGTATCHSQLEKEKDFIYPSRQVGHQLLKKALEKHLVPT